MFERLPNKYTRYGAALGLTALAFVGTTKSAEAVQSHTIEASTVSPSQFIDSVPSTLYTVIKSSKNTFSCPASKKDTGMSQPVCEAMVVRKGNNRFVLNYTHEKGESGVDDISIYTVTETDISTGDLQLMGYYLDDNGTTIAVINDGSQKPLHYLNLDSATTPKEDQIKIAQYSKELVDGVR